MPREPRIYIEKVLYFITANSLDDRELFQDADDYTAYLKSLAELKRELGFKLFSYCLLPKRLFLLIELQNDVSISSIMHELNGNYTKKYNSRYGKKGHLFQSRFKSILMEKDPYLLRMTRFIHLLPREVGIINNVASYPFSSYFTYTYEDHQSHTGMQWPNIAQEVREVIGCFSGADCENEQVDAYAQYVQSAGDEELEDVKNILHRTAFVGSKGFKSMIRKRIEQHLNDEQRSKAVRKINPAYALAGSLIVIFLTAATFFLYSGQTKLRSTLDVTANGLGIAKDELVKRVTTLEVEIGNYEEKENYGLGGFAWELQLAPVHKDEQSQVYKDHLQFKGGQVISASMMKRGFVPFDYTISQESHGEKIWQTVQTKPDGTTVRWYGVITGDQMRGVVSEIPVEGKNRDFSFVSIRRVNENGRANNVVQ